MRLEIFNKPGFGRRLRKVAANAVPALSNSRPAPAYDPGWVETVIRPAPDPLPEQPQAESKADQETPATDGETQP